MSEAIDYAATPPPDYSPEALKRWLTPHAAGVHVRRMDAFRNDTGGLENLELQLDIEQSATNVAPSERFIKGLEELTGHGRFATQFEVPAIVELVASALAKGRFRGYVRVSADGETLYEHSDRKRDPRAAVELLTEAGHRATRCDHAAATVLDDDFGDSRAHLDVKRVPKTGVHSIHLRFDGEVPEGDFQAVLSHLRTNLPVTFVPAGQ